MGPENVIALTDVNDNVKRTYEYDAWGVLTGGTDYASLAPYDYFRFKGAFSDPNHTGLSYMRNRWYEPESGRFMSEDPIGLAGGINPYSFAANNPITLSDPSGDPVRAERLVTL